LDSTWSEKINLAHILLLGKKLIFPN